MRRNHEPGTATTSIASSACLLPAKRHGMHASMSRLLITNMSLAGSWLCKESVRGRNVKAATYSCTLYADLSPAYESICSLREPSPSIIRNFDHGLPETHCVADNTIDLIGRPQSFAPDIVFNCSASAPCDRVPLTCRFWPCLYAIALNNVAICTGESRCPNYIAQSISAPSTRLIERGSEGAAEGGDA